MRRHAGKRGGEVRPVSLEEAALVSPERAGELVAFDEALKELEELSQRQSRVVELRYFGGLTNSSACCSGFISRRAIIEWLVARVIVS